MFILALTLQGLTFQTQKCQPPWALGPTSYLEILGISVSQVSRESERIPWSRCAAGVRLLIEPLTSHTVRCWWPTVQAPEMQYPCGYGFGRLGNSAILFMGRFWLMHLAVKSRFFQKTTWGFCHCLEGQASNTAWMCGSVSDSVVMS